MTQKHPYSFQWLAADYHTISGIPKLLVVGQTLLQEDVSAMTDIRGGHAQASHLQESGGV